jgi:APA family basic amino acid/polyamine antiporter
MPPVLRRALRLPQATALVAGIIIGASIFAQPSEIIRLLPTTSAITLAWLAAGALTLCGALVCAELASAFPKTGGVYVFLTEAFGPALGFLWGWAMFWTMHSGILAAIAVVFARYLAVFVPLGEIGQRLAAAGIIALLSAINYAGVRRSGAVQTSLTAIKVLAIAALIAAGWWAAPAAAHAMTAAAEPAGVGAFVLAVGAGLFAFGGWHMVTYAAGETVDPTRTIPRALIIGTLIVTACYAGLNAAYLRVLPIDALRGTSRIAADFAQAIAGPAAARFASALVLISTMGALNGIVLAGPRVYFSMAKDGLLFPAFGRVHPVFETPHVAIALQGVWAAALALTNSYRALFSRVVYTEWIFFGLMGLGLIILRRRPAYRPSVRVPGYPGVPVMFALAAFLVVGIQVRSQPLDSALGLGFVLLGLPVYRVWVWRMTRTQATTPVGDA